MPDILIQREEWDAREQDGFRDRALPVSEQPPTYPSEDVPDDVDLEQPAQDPTPDLPEED